jgi:hypothetical protein
MKTTEEIQQAFSDQGQSPPGTNGRMGDSARKRTSRAALLVGFGIIFAGLLITATPIIGGLQDGAQPHEQGDNGGRICDLISAQIADLIRAWEGTSVHISVEGDGDGYTLTSGRIVLILRSYQSGVSLDEIIEVQDNIRDRAVIELGEPPGPIVIALPCAGTEPLPPVDLPPGLPQPERVETPIVAYGFAICDDWVGIGHSASTVVDYAGGATAKTELTRIHHEALEWFRQQLVSQHGRQ